jgi:hypothetical protein
LTTAAVASFTSGAVTFVLKTKRRVHSWSNLLEIGGHNCRGRLRRMRWNEKARERGRHVGERGREIGEDGRRKKGGKRGKRKEVDDAKRKEKQKEKDKRKER